ncbi:MAG TPA: hypothetical protein VGE41_00100, partial [Verrucomicrobiae bacterium]
MRRPFPNSLLDCASLFLLGCMLLFCAGCDSGKSVAASKNPPVTDQRVTTIDGLEFDPIGAGKTNKATVLVFTSTDCPISNRYAPTVRRICEKYALQNIVVWLVYPHDDITADDIRKHLKEYNYPCPGLRDPGHKLVKL